MMARKKETWKYTGTSLLMPPCISWCLESAQDDLKDVTTEAERVIEQLQDKQDSPTKTRPIPFVRV